MGRPWEYPNWRRVAMQLVMWLILCATLGLAEIVTRTRGIEGAQQVRVGPVIVRLPYGWKLDSADAVHGLRAHDPDGERQLFVIVVPLKRTEIAATGSDYQGPSSIEFKGLHRTGFMELEHRTTGDQDIETRLAATAVVPSVRVKLRVGFNLAGEEPTGPEVSLLERIASGITLAPDARPQIGPPDGNVVLNGGAKPQTASR
ncbi:MAG TPA: hypothetical protein VK797_06140 [Tepidisphaeraceae bacterium]|jgi:hypothetical protein|nr:hypothetical protein [Tepidisphaeraceae bacterium]